MHKKWHQKKQKKPQQNAFDIVSQKYATLRAILLT